MSVKIFKIHLIFLRKKKKEKTLTDLYVDQDLTEFVNIPTLESLIFLFLVKYLTLPCSLKTLFFASLIFHFFHRWYLYAMGKDGYGTFVHFSVQNWRIFTSTTRDTIKITTRGPQIFLIFNFNIFLFKKKNL
jgi:hypothetical protein